jgi:hypothetical protein
MHCLRFLGFVAFGLAHTAAADSKLSNPEGNWQLTAPASVVLSARYERGGGGKTGSLALADFPAESGNAAGLIPATANIEYQPSPAQITFHLSTGTSFLVALDKHGAGLAPQAHSETSAVPGYACIQKTSFDLGFKFSSDVKLVFTLLQRIEFVSTGATGNCADYLAGVATQLDAGTAPALWSLFAASGGIKVKKLPELKELDLSYAFAGLRLSPVTTLLPHCTDAPLFSIAPVDLTQVLGVVPLGNFNPPGHTLPTPHSYYYLKRANPANALDWSVPSVATPARAMGDVRITRVESSESLSSVPPYTDYTIRYSGCREVDGYYHHLSSLDPAFAGLVGPIDPSACETYATGGVTFRRCFKDVAIDVGAGYVLGTAGGNMQANALDVGMRDQRVTLAYISPTKHASDATRTVCATNYMAPALRLTVEGMFGSYAGDYHRTAAPVCGGVMHDVAGTASGDWFFPGASTDHDDPHLALTPNNINPAFSTFSVGTSVASLPTGVYSFAPAVDPAASVNRSFDAVVPGAVYCYEALGSFVAAGLESPVARIIFLDMPDSAHVRIASTGGVSSCGTGPFVMPAVAAIFER